MIPLHPCWGQDLPLFFAWAGSMATIVEVIRVVANTMVIAIKRSLFVFIDPLNEKIYLKLLIYVNDTQSYFHLFKYLSIIKQKE